MNSGILLAALAAAFAALTIISLFLGFANPKKRDKVEQSIEDLLESEIESTKKEDDLPKIAWFRFWYLASIKSGQTTQDNKNRPGYIAIAIIGISLFAGLTVWPRDIFGAVFLAAGLTYSYRAYFNYLVAKRTLQIDKQLPNMLALMKSNLQANFTPQQALVAQAEELAAPLGDEFKILRDEIAVNVPLDKALENMADRVPSKEMGFLISSVRLAISSGADLEPQITIIQEIVTQRTKIANLLATAVAQVQPAILVTGIMVPAAYLFSVYGNETNQEFWVSLNGFIATGIVGVLYATGLFIAKKQVDRVKKA